MRGIMGARGIPFHDGNGVALAGRVAVRAGKLQNSTCAKGQARNTFRVVFTMIFGTLDQALAASRHLYLLHTRIQGKLPASVAAYVQGSRYEANEVNALLWVYATLVESALLAYDSVLPPLSK